MPVHLKFIVGFTVILSASISANLFARDIVPLNDDGECPDGYFEYDEGSCESRKSRYELSMEYSQRMFDYLDRKSALVSKMADIELELSRLGASIDAEGTILSTQPKTTRVIELEKEWQPLLAEHETIEAEYKRLDAEQERLRSQLY